MSDKAARRPGWLLRVVFKLPLYLYRWRLGWLLGHRFVLLTHVGRKSGQVYQTVLEVIRYDPRTRKTVVISGYGARADWYRNLQAHPARRIETGRERYTPVQHFLDTAESYQELQDYRRRHPWLLQILLRWFGGLFGIQYEGQAATVRTLAAQTCLVAFRPADTAPGPGHRPG